MSKGNVQRSTSNLQRPSGGNAGFTLLEVVLAVMILGLTSIGIFKFVQSNLRAIQYSVEDAEESISIDRLVSLVQEELYAIPARGTNGTLLSAEVDHRQATYAKPALVLMGNEQQGLTPDMAALCDVNVKIPMRGRADSLNLSVATGIMIYAAT